METAGLSKAMAVLSRYEGMKKIAFFDSISNPNLPQMHRMTGTRKKRKKGDDSGVAQQTGSAAAHTLGGMGAGRIVSDFAHGPGLTAAKKMRKRQWYGMAAGAGAGISTYVGKRMAKKEQEQEKKAAMSPSVLSPKKQLQYGQQTAKTFGRGLRSGPSLGRLATKVRL